MTFLADKLNKRISIVEPTQTPRGDGGIDRSYSSVLDLWANMLPVQAGQYVRGVQIGEGITHQFTVRKRPLDEISESESFDVVSLKKTYFIRYLIDEGTKGRIFKIISMINNKEENEYYIINTEETLNEDWY